MCTLYVCMCILSVCVCLHILCVQMAQRALAQELLCPEGGLSSSYHLAMARLQLLRAEYSSAQLSLQEALNDSFQVPITNNQQTRGLFHEASLPNKPGLCQLVRLISSSFGSIKPAQRSSKSVTMATYASKLAWSRAG